MQEAKKVGLEKVMLDCDVNNLGSDRTLKALGGKLERTEIDPSDGVLTNVYWFNVDDTLNNYKDIYEPNISTDETKIKKIHNSIKKRNFACNLNSNNQFKLHYND